MNDQCGECVKGLNRTAEIKEERFVKNFTPSYKQLKTFRPRLNFDMMSPRIFPSLSIKPPMLPKSSELFSKPGMIFKTLASARNIRGMLIPKYFKSVHSSVKRERKVERNYGRNSSGIQLQGKIKLNSNIRMRMVQGLKKDLDEKSKEKNMGLREMIMKIDTLTGWELS